MKITKIPAKAIPQIVAHKKVSLDELEKLIADTAEIFTKIYNLYLLGWVEFSFPPYDVLVAKFEESIQIIAKS